MVRLKGSLRLAFALSDRMSQALGKGRAAYSPVQLAGRNPWNKPTAYSPERPEALAFACAFAFAVACAFAVAFAYSLATKAYRAAFAFAFAVACAFALAYSLATKAYRTAAFFHARGRRRALQRPISLLLLLLLLFHRLFVPHSLRPRTTCDLLFCFFLKKPGRKQKNALTCFE